MNTETFFDKSKQNSFTLDMDAPLGSGGEGTVYSVLNKRGMAAKLFHNSTDELECRVIARTELAHRPPQLVLPEAPLYDADGHFRGFTMKKVYGLPLDHLLDPFIREVEYPGVFEFEDLLDICRNIAVIVSTATNIGDQIGDFNPPNWRVSASHGSSPLVVSKLDTESHQFWARDRKTGVAKKYTSHLAVPELVPPELINSLSTTGFTETSDRFALACLIFRLVFGQWPFSWCYSDGHDPGIVEAIRNGWFMFAPVTPIRPTMTPAPTQITWDELPEPLRSCFLRTFVDGFVNPEARSSPEEFNAALDKWRTELSPPPLHGAAIFLRGLRALQRIRFVRTLFNRVRAELTSLVEKSHSMSTTSIIGPATASAAIAVLLTITWWQGGLESGSDAPEKPLIAKELSPPKAKSHAPCNYPGATRMWNDIANEE